jgi:hypothetical protein
LNRVTLIHREKGKGQFHLSVNDGKIMKTLLTIIALALLLPAASGRADTASLTFNGKLRDRVRLAQSPQGFGEEADCLAPDGQLDGTFTVQFEPGTGSHHIVQVEIDGNQIWNTVPHDQRPVVGVARSLDDPLLNIPSGDGAGYVDFTLEDGASLNLFIATANDGTFTPSYHFSAIVSFDDGTGVQVECDIPYTPPDFTYDGTLRDRVGLGDTALAPDGKLDGTFTVRFNAGSGVRTVRKASLTRFGSNNAWDTFSPDSSPILGIARSLDGPLLNGSDASVTFLPQVNETFKIFVSDNGNLFVGGWTFYLSLVYDDNTTDLMSVTLKADVFGNISTRVRVGGGDNVLIGGFIVNGGQGATKRVLVRAIGPSLNAFGLAGLPNPVLELHDSAGNVMINDNWQEGGTLNQQPYASQKDDIQAAGLAPNDLKEAAMIVTVPAGNTTAIIRSASESSSGTAVIEVYDLEQNSFIQLANISTRGKVELGNDPMIAGIIVLGQSPQDILVRALGPSLGKVGVANTLQDPALGIYDANGATIALNDDWHDQSGNPQGRDVSIVPPGDDREAALRVVLMPAPYTAIVRAADKAPASEKTGVSLVEAYHLE